MARKKNRRVYNYIPCIHRSVMAKLYWRIKKNGKWTWRPLRCADKFTQTIIDRLRVQDGIYMEEEEE